MDGVKDIKTSVTDMQKSFGHLQTSVASELQSLRLGVDLRYEQVDFRLQGVEKRVGSVGADVGGLLELAAAPLIDATFGAQLPGAKSIRTAEELVRVILPDDFPSRSSAAVLAEALADRDVGFLCLLMCAVKALHEMAEAQGAARCVLEASQTLHRMSAVQEIEAWQQTSPVWPEADKMVQALHRSGVGRLLFASLLSRYLKGSAADRQQLLQEDMFIPCLSARATGKALPELQLDRCGRINVEIGLAESHANLNIGEVKLAGSSLGGAQQQLCRSSEIIGFAYHTVRERTNGKLPAVFDVYAHVLMFSEPQKRSPEPAPVKRLEMVGGLGVPLTIYFRYYIVGPGAIKRYRS